jgi:hypothetical protein
MHWVFFAWVAGCGSGGSGDGSVLPGEDGAVTVDGGNPTDGSAGDLSTADLGPLTVSCHLDGPTLLVRQPASGPSSTLARLPLSFSHAASGIKITSVTQTNTGGTTPIRTWNASTFAGPPGFTGSAIPTTGNTSAGVLFSATDASLQSEVDACGVAPWKRPSGQLHVVGSTQEGGEFAVDCGYGLSYGGNNAEPLRFACARGLAGWLGGSGSDAPAISQFAVPIAGVLASAGVHVHNIDAAALSGVSATAGTVTGHARQVVPPACPMGDPAPWTLGAGIHELWNGTSSAQIWSGPVAPSTEEYVHWLFQQDGAMLPSGLCVPAGMGIDSCPPPILQVVITGTSSAGTYQWESDLFECYTHS